MKNLFSFTAKTRFSARSTFPARLAGIFSLTALPLLVSAQSSLTSVLPDSSALGAYIVNINKNIVAALATLFIAGAVAAFFFGIAKFILASRDGDTGEIKKGQQFMLWGVIALFVMFSIYGIIIFGQKALGISGDTDIKLPRILLDGSNNGGNNNPTPPPLPTPTCPIDYTSCGLAGREGVCYKGSCVPNSCIGKADGAVCSIGSDQGSCQTGVCKKPTGASDIKIGDSCGANKVVDFGKKCVDIGSVCDVYGTPGFIKSDGSCDTSSNS